MAFTANQQIVVDLFIAAYGRAPAQGGLDFFTGELDKNGTDSSTGMSAADIRAYMMDTTNNSEAETRYSTGTAAENVETVFQNVLGRGTSSEAGSTYWTEYAEENGMDALMQAVLDEAKNNTDDAQTLTNKSDVAEYFLNNVAVADQAGSQVSLDAVTYLTGTTTAITEVTQLTGFTAPTVAPTYTIAATASSVEEGSEIVFTVTASEADFVNATTLNYSIAGVEVAGNTATPQTDLGLLNGTVTIAAGDTTGTITLTPTDDRVTEGFEGFSVTILNDDFTASDATVDVTIKDPANAGQTFNLTTSSDTAPDFTGGAGDDIYKAGEDFSGTVDVAGVATDVYHSHLNSTDVIDGGAGNDQINITAESAVTLPAMTLSNVETMNIASGGAIDADVSISKITGLETVNTTGSTTVDVLAGATTDVNVSGASGTIDVAGGKNITVTDATATNVITVGQTANASGSTATNAAGTITVTDTVQTTEAIVINGGTDVTVTTTIDAKATAIDGGDLSIGAAKAATGAVSVTQNLNADGGDADGDDLTAANISVTGGTTVDVTVNATVTADDTAAEGDIAVGTIGVQGNGDTTAVTVTQNTTATAFKVAKVAEVDATQDVTFKALAEGENASIVHGGNTLIFTAAKALDAEEVAAAFADMANNDRQDNGGVTANGIYSGQFPAAWATQSVSGATVTFVANAYDTSTLANTGSTATALPTVAPIVAGTVAAAATTTTNTATKGAVSVIDEHATAADAITTVTLDGFNNALIGVNATTTAVSQLDALTTLNLSNNTKDDVIEVGTAATTLTLNVDNITSTGTTYINLDNDGNGAKDANDATVTALTINATGDDSAFELVAGALKNLTVNATADLNISDTAASYATANLETVDVNGAGAVDLGVMSASVNLDSFDASGNTGGVTATVEAGEAQVGDIEEFIFSGANDTVTVTDATTTDKTTIKVSTGAGDDKVILSSGIDTAGAVIDGGTGTNTLHMDAADAVTATAADTFEAKVDNFTKLSLGNATATGTVDLANMDDISYVISANSGVAGASQEVFTVDFTTSGTVTGADTITFDAITTTLAGGEDATAIATAVAGGAYTNYTAVDNGAGTVTFTTNTAGAVAPDIAAGDFTMVDADATTAAGVVTNTTQGTVTYTFNTTGMVLDNTDNALGADTFSILDYTYTAQTANDDLTDVVTNMTATVTINSIVYTVSSTSTTELVLTTTDTNAPATLTYTAANPDAPTADNFVAGTNSGAAQSLANGATEVFEVDFSTSGAIEDGDTIAYDGVTTTLTTGMTAAQIGQAVAGQAYTNYTASNLGNGVVQFTHKTAGTKTDDVIGDFTITNVNSASADVVATVTTDTQGADAGTTPTLTLDNMANDGTLELTTAGAGVNVTVKDADDNTVAGYDNNTLNVIISDAITAGGIDVGSVVVNDVENVDITVNDAFTDTIGTTDEYGVVIGDGDDDTDAAHTINVSADAVKTITVDGAGDVTLTVNATATTGTIETVNASALTGVLNYNALVAETVVTGGSAADILTASANEIEINGGAGNDQITVADDVDKVVVDGGEGNDTFFISGAATTIDNYAVFNNVASGDTFDFSGVANGEFQATEIALSQGATLSTQSLIGEATKTLTEGDIGWFQYDGNTFIVANIDGNGGTANVDTYEAGFDAVIMISGLVDLGTGASFNTSTDTLEIA